MELDTQIANAISKYIDCKYAIDNPGKGIGQGYDCLNTLLGFYEDLGVEMPHEFEGWTLENYGKNALADPDKAHKKFERFVQILGCEVPIKQMVRGDMVLFKVLDIGTYAGICLGNGNVFLVFDKGGRVCPIAPFHEHIKQVRRLLPPGWRPSGPEAGNL